MTRKKIGRYLRGRRQPRRFGNRSGWTVVEVLVAVSLIGVLMALLLPAVQVSRASSRLLTCRNHLRQIGQGIQSFAAVKSGLPGTHESVTALSVHVQLLPFLDHDALYRQFVNATVPAEPYTFRFKPWAELAYKHFVSVYHCPADVFGSSDPGAVNYCLNMGVNNPDGWSRSGLGAFPPGQQGTQSPALFRDGLSQTVFLSELHSESSGTERATGDVRQQARLIRLLPRDGRDLNGFRDKCLKSLVEYPFVELNTIGFDWYLAQPGRAGYTHDLPPFSPSCQNRSRVTRSIVSARSWHPAAVHGLLGDGSVRTVSQDIDANLWMALGCRDDAHLVDF